MLMGTGPVPAAGDDAVVVAEGLTASELDPAAGLDPAASPGTAVSVEELCDC